MYVYNWKLSIQILSRSSVQHCCLIHCNAVVYHIYESDFRQNANYGECCCGIVVSNTLVCNLEVGISYIEFDRQFINIAFTGLTCGQITVPLLSLEQLTFPF